METVTDFIFLDSKITEDGGCSHETKRPLLLGRKAMTNLDSVLKSRDITLLTKVHIIKGMIFPVVLYRCKSWTVKKFKCQRIDAFKLCCWRRLLRVLWTAKISNQSILKEVNPEYSLEGLILKLKLRHLATWCEELIHWKRHWCWKKLKAGGEGDERMRWLDAMSLSELWEMVKDREAWHAAVHGVTKSWTRLSNWTMTTRPKYSDPPGAMHSLIPQPAHTCLCQPSNRPLMSTTLQFMVTNRIQSKELCGVLTQSCGSQPWLQSSIPWRTLRNPAPHEDQPQQSVWGRTQDFTEFFGESSMQPGFRNWCRTFKAFLGRVRQCGVGPENFSF